MHLISKSDCLHVAGGITGQDVAAGAAAIAGGYVAYRFADFFSPVATLGWTIAGAVGVGAAGAICTPFFPPAGAIMGGSIGALSGYVFGASFNNALFFTGGAVISYFAASRAMS
jgi:hypothetical protein